MSFKYFGCAYYPEVWPEERWDKDIEMMKRIGFNVVRIGEFAWSKSEPREGEYTFGWLHRILDKMNAAGIRVMLCTPSAVPPQWMVRNFPGIRLMKEDGNYQHPNSRRHYCVSSPEYRAFIARFLTKAGEEFASHPAVCSWQIDNEIALAETGGCYCPECRKQFLDFLKAKYRTLEALNKAWGCGFWSNDYADWEEIELPLKRQSHLLDWSEFETQQFASFIKEQRDVLKKSNPDWLITTNSWIALEPEISPAPLFETLDFTAYDCYVNVYENLQTYRSAWSYYRNLKGRPFPFWLTETGAWNPLSGADNAFGALRAWAWELFARGCEGMIYFRWRQSLMGEENHPAILPWDGSESEAYHQLCKLGEEMRAANPGELPLPQTRVALLADPKTALIERNRKSCSFKREFALFHDFLNRLGVDCDILPVEKLPELSSYKLLILPQMEFVSENTAQVLKSFVQNGGCVLGMPRLSILDENGKYLPERSPYRLRDLFGAGVSEYSEIRTAPRHPFHAFGEEPSASLPDVCGDLNGSHAEFSVWMEKIIPENAEICGHYRNGAFAGEACFTKHRFGSGFSWMLGTLPNSCAMRRLLRSILTECGIEHLPHDLPSECTILTRGNVRFYINASENTQTLFRFDGSSLKLQGYDVAIEEC